MRSRRTRLDPFSSAMSPSPPRRERKFNATHDSTVEILCWVDDHSRYAISVTAHRRVSGRIVVATFTKALEEHGIPASTPTDNGMVFTTRLSGGKGGRNGFEHLLDSLGIHQKNSRPNRPTTCGKVERFHQTLKRWLTARPAPATITELQETARRIRQPLQPAPPPPLTKRTHPRRRLPDQTQSHPLRRAPAALPGAERQSQPRQRRHCASTATSTTSGSAATSTEPPS